MEGHRGQRQAAGLKLRATRGGDQGRGVWALPLGFLGCKGITAALPTPVCVCHSPGMKSPPACDSRTVLGAVRPAPLLQVPSLPPALVQPGQCGLGEAEGAEWPGPS